MSGHLASSESTSFTPNSLFAGDGPVKTKNDAFAASLDLPANRVIARNSSTGLLVAYDAAGSNSTNVAVGITCEAVNTSAGSAVHPYYFMGDFNRDALVWGTATDAQKAAAFDRTAIKVRVVPA
jgi:hypothetical protein